uniref:HAT C-terminal dimerisation domain-containing protein n=1 Tax=Rhodnius prolixus TaxID=13249 RepID=T1IAA1_RHOPR
MSEQIRRRNRNKNYKFFLRTRGLPRFFEGSVLVIPVSSSAVERLFSATGLLLSKLRKRMSPAVVINSVYIRFACKMKIVEMVQGLPGLTELLETVDEQEIDSVLNEQSDSEIE